MTQFPNVKCYVLEFNFRYDKIPPDFSLNMTGMNAVKEIGNFFNNLTDSELVCKNIISGNYGNTFNGTATAVTIGTSLRLTVNDSLSLSKVNSVLVDCITAVQTSLVRTVGPRLFGHNASGDKVVIRPHEYQLESIKSCCGTTRSPCCLVESEVYDGNSCGELI